MLFVAVVVIVDSIGLDLTATVANVDNGSGGCDDGDGGDETLLVATLIKFESGDSNKRLYVFTISG